MSQHGTTSRSGYSRALVAGIALLALFGVAGVYWWARPARFDVVEMAHSPAVPPASVAVAPAQPVAPVARAPEAAAAPARDTVAPASSPASASAAAPAVAPGVGAGPSFDVVRVGPKGDAVIAGRAAPGAEVVIRDGGEEVARARADRQGTFVAIPAAPLAAGGRELTLGAREAGRAEVAGTGSVLLTVPAVVPQAVAPVPAPVVAVLVPNAAPPRVLQDGPGVPAAKAGVTLDTVDYDDAGAIRFTGNAAPGTAVRVYVDNGVVGDVRADERGRWTLTPGAAVTAGVHTLRVDQLDAGGRVSGRVELPFQRAVITPAELAGGQVVVQPGQSLWRLARLAYGRGVQYRVIYLANREQIRDPRLIYPGQTFAVPTP